MSCVRASRPAPPPGGGGPERGGGRGQPHRRPPPETAGRGRARIMRRSDASAEEVTGYMAKRENETTAALKRAQLFRTLAPAALARLALNATAVSLPRGEQLCRSGERCPG